MQQTKVKMIVSSDDEVEQRERKRNRNMNIILAVIIIALILFTIAGVITMLRIPPQEDPTSPYQGFISSHMLTYAQIVFPRLGF
jgi:hypothetical protein